MSRLTFSERQLKALYSITQSLNMTGGRFGIAQTREPRRRVSPQDVFEPSDETTLTYDEMRDLELRLAEFLFPHQLSDHDVEVAVK